MTVGLSRPLPALSAGPTAFPGWAENQPVTLGGAARALKLHG